MRTLQVEIRCGKKSCAEKPGVFCQFLRARADGSQPNCALFGKRVFDKDGDILDWLLRCDECHKAEEDAR
jgi:hypothetical protein